MVRFFNVTNKINNNNVVTNDFIRLLMRQLLSVSDFIIDEN